MRTLLKDLSVTLLSRILCSICNDSEEELINIFFFPFLNIRIRIETKGKGRGDVRGLCR